MQQRLRLRDKMQKAAQTEHFYVNFIIFFVLFSKTTETTFMAKLQL